MAAIRYWNSSTSPRQEALQSKIGPDSRVPCHGSEHIMEVVYIREKKKKEKLGLPGSTTNHVLLMRRGSRSKKGYCQQTLHDCTIRSLMDSSNSSISTTECRGLLWGRFHAEYMAPGEHGSPWHHVFRKLPPVVRKRTLALAFISTVGNRIRYMKIQ